MSSGVCNRGLSPIVYSNVKSMDQLLSLLKDYTAIVVACVAASVSIVNLVWSTRLNEGRDRRRALWERELNRFAELEDAAGRLVEEVLSYKACIDEQFSATVARLQALRETTGQFLRYPDVAEALRDITQSTAWCISCSMKHESMDEIEEARKEVTVRFGGLVAAIDEALKNAHKRL